VAIILIIATIAIPSLLRSRQSANETAAVANLRSLNTAQVTYASSIGAFGALSDLASSGLVDSRFASGVVSGYNLSISLSSDSLDYTMVAAAVSTNSGRYDYYSKPDYVIRYSTVASRAPSGLAGEPVR